MEMLSLINGASEQCGMCSTILGLPLLLCQESPSRRFGGFRWLLCGASALAAAVATAVDVKFDNLSFGLQTFRMSKPLQKRSEDSPKVLPNTP